LATISTIYDAINTVLATKLPQHRQLPNPYEVTQNTYLHLNKAYGIGVGPGQDTERYVGCLITWEQVHQIILVRRIVTTQNNTVARETLEKDLLEDWDILRKAFYLDNTLSGSAIKTTVTSHSGINFIDGDKLKFLGLEIQLVVEYQENPTA
jgi:hypothetical protein